MYTVLMKPSVSILVIDDEIYLKDVYTKFLEKIGAKITFCDHPQKGWQAIDKDQYDLIITDLKMPIISGDEFISIIRVSSLNAHTPIILCSGHINKMIVTELARESKIYFLAKPFESSELFELVKKVISVKHSEVVDNQVLSEKWLKAFSSKLDDLIGDKVQLIDVDRFEPWNFEIISLSFNILHNNESLNTTLMMKLNTFLKIAGKNQGTQYKEVETETLEVWKDFLSEVYRGVGRVTFSKNLAQEFLTFPEQTSAFKKIETSLGEILIYLN